MGVFKETGKELYRIHHQPVGINSGIGIPYQLIHGIGFHYRFGRIMHPFQHGRQPNQYLIALSQSHK